MARHKLIAAFVLWAVLFCGLNLNAESRAQRDKTEPAAKEAESRALLEQTRRNVLAGLNELPNFVVEQKIGRYGRPAQKKDWLLLDRLEIEITYQADKGEQFKLQRVNDDPAQQSYESLGGSTSTGEFGSILVAIFLPSSKAQFEEFQRQTYHGRPTVIYDFSVLKQNSTSTVSDKTAGKQIVCGYFGRVWIDTENKAVLRLELNDSLPDDFGISMSEHVIEYDWVKIGNKRYLMPTTPEVVMGYNHNRQFTRNVIDFRNYHKFEGKMKVLDE